MLSFRRAGLPAPIERIELSHHAVPRGLDGVTILHISDIHARRFAPESSQLRCLVRALESVEVDLLVITGDSMDEPGNEAAAIRVLQMLATAARVRTGAYLVLGNHDRDTLARRLPAVQGMTSIGVTSPSVLDLKPRGEAGPTLRLMGLSYPEDVLELAGHDVQARADMLPLLIAHHPDTLLDASHAGIPIVLAGHTHGGQVRVSTTFSPHTSSDFPPTLAGGMLRLGNTLCCVSRGVGEGLVENFRVNCPRQMPLYTLRAGPTRPLPKPEKPLSIQRVLGW